MNAEHLHMDAYSPREGYGELPSFALNGGLDVAGWEVVGKVDVQLDVFEVWWVVHHVEHQTA